MPGPASSGSTGRDVPGAEGFSCSGAARGWRSCPCGRGDGDGWRLEPDDGGDPVDVPPGLAARPAEDGLTLDGAYRATGGVGAVGTGVPVVAAWNEVVFSADGTLVAANGGSADAGDVAAGGSTTLAGRYRLDGWTATVEYADGRTERVLFYLFPDSDDAVGFAGLTLSRRR